MNLLAILLAFIIVPLQLPPGTTVRSPFEVATSTRNPFSVGGDTIAADLTRPRWPWPTVALWTHFQLMTLPPMPKKPDSYIGPFVELGAVAPNGKFFGMRAQPFSGAYSGIWYDIFKLENAQWIPATSNGCDVDGTVAHIEKIEADGTLDLTYESPDLINFDYVYTESYAPYAARLSSGQCRLLGRFQLRDRRGRYAVGFRGYIKALAPRPKGTVTVLAPDNLNVAEQRYVAVRYDGSSLKEIGPGEAFAVLPDGTTVGSDAPTINQHYSEGHNGTFISYACCTPHAVLWTTNNRIIRLAPQARQSIAYDIDLAHRVIGTLIGRDGRHYAFLWTRGHLHLLDEIYHTPGWRFEGAYRFTQKDAIVGIATHNGIATGFVFVGATAYATAASMRES